jgi:hypothetical protein
MHVSLVTDVVSLEPDVPVQVLLDVVNTDDVIDAVRIDLTGLTGATVDLEGTPTLFPGERRRLPLRVTLPTRVPAGRHGLDVVVRATASEKERRARLNVEVGARPALRVGANPSVRRGIRSACFPITIANRGNTSLLVRPGEIDLPDGVGVSFGPDELMLEPWQTKICSAEISGRKHLLGTVREHLADLRITAESVTPGDPLLQEELHQDVRLTFRQRPVVGHGLVFAVLLSLVLAIWGTLGYLGLRAFARPEPPGLDVPAGFLFGPGPRQAPGAALTTSGQVLSLVDGSPVGGVTVLMCSLDAPVRGSRPCDRRTSTYETSSDGEGHFLVPHTFPAAYEIVFQAAGQSPVRLAKSVAQRSCRVTGYLPGRPTDLTLKVTGAADSAASTVRVGAVVATYQPPVAPDVSGSTSPPTTTESVPPTCPPVRAAGKSPGRGGIRGGGETARSGLTFVGASHRTVDRSGPGPTGKGDERPDRSADAEQPDGSPGARFPTTPRADGGWAGDLTVKGLMGPASYDVTVTAGEKIMHLCGVRVVPGQKNTYPVVFTSGSVACPSGSR